MGTEAVSMTHIGIGIIAITIIGEAVLGDIRFTPTTTDMIITTLTEVVGAFP